MVLILKLQQLGDDLLGSQLLHWRIFQVKLQT
jgi:hypothetical protein